MLAGLDGGYGALPASPRLSELVREAAAIGPRIGGDLDFIRVDLLVTESGFYGGELTVYSDSGYEKWANPIAARNLEQHWDLRQSGFMRSRHRGLKRIYADALRVELDRRDMYARMNSNHRRSSEL